MPHFILAGTQRTGTSFIESTLDSHPEICSFGEIFLFRKGRGANIVSGYRHYINQAPAKRMVRHYLARRGLIKEYLDQLGSDCRGSAVGFKLMLGQTRILPCVPEYIRHNNYRVIQIVRRNPLKIYLSRAALRRSKVAHTDRKLKVQKIMIPTERLVSHLDKVLWENCWAERTFPDLDRLAVYYEDFVASREEQLRKISEFLGIAPYEGMKSDLIKLNPDKLSDLIENFEEVAVALKGTQYEQYII
jgi:hypothetical protein